MKILIVKGVYEEGTGTVSKIVSILKKEFNTENAKVAELNLGDAKIPFFESRKVLSPPVEVIKMAETFLEYEIQIWLTPLYHGGMTGAFKNALDWLLITANNESPYLTNKVIGLVCWGYGGNASTGIDQMRTIASTLRAWALPYSVPVVRESLLDDDCNISPEYDKRFRRMTTELVKASKLIL